MNTVNSTVQAAGPGRRVVRRKPPALDDAWATVLADFDPALRPAIIEYADAKRAEYEARQSPSAELTRAGCRWRDVDPVVNKLLF